MNANLNVSREILALVCAVAVSGCAAEKRGVVLAPVGPALAEHHASDSNGSLIVFTALDPNAHFSGFTYHAYMSDYKIFGDNGVLLKTVHNDSGEAEEGPVPVSLPPGKYRVVAHANGYGKVTVPVVIAAHRATVVHLDGGSLGSSGQPSNPGDAVCLPNGQIVGWRAENRDLPQSAAVSRNN